MFNNFVTKIRSIFSNESGRTAALTFGRSVILTSVVVTGVVVGLRQLGTMEGLELGAYDQLVRSRADEGQDNRLLVVAVTEEDIQTRKEYPIKDDTLAQLLAKLQQYQPRTIGIDILRDVPQGTSQGRIALEKILKQDESIIAVCKMSSANQPGIPAAPGVTEERVGFADLPLDSGGVLRRSLLLSNPVPPKTPPPVKHLCNIPDPENQLPSFSFQLALLYLEAMKIQPDAEYTKKTGNLKIGSAVFKRLEKNSSGYRNTDAEDYRLMLNYRSPRNPAKQVSITEVLNGKIDPKLVKDRIVLVGYTAPSVRDEFYTPYSAGFADNQKMPGVVIHAQNVSQILSTVLNHRPLIWYWSQGSEILWIWGWSLLGALLAWRIRRLWLFGLGVLVAAGVLYGVCYVLFLNAGWVPLVPPIFGLAATAIVVVLIERGYAKAIYQGVKKVILNIEIDEEKKQKDIAAITETESFAELQQKAAELRKSRKKDKTSDNGSELSTETNETTPTPQDAEPIDIETKTVTPTPPDAEPIDAEPIDIETKTVTPTPQDAEPAEEDDYLQRLQQRGNKLKRDAATPTPQDAESSESEQDDYLQGLQKRGRRLKKNEEDSSK